MLLHQLLIISKGHHLSYPSCLSWAYPQQEVLYFASCRIVWNLITSLQATAALTLESPSKPSKKEVVVLINDEKHSQSPESMSDAPHMLPDFHRKFVGKVDLPES